jgi:hypothetical protein
MEGGRRRSQMWMLDREVGIEDGAEEDAGKEDIGAAGAAEMTR